MPVLTWPQDGEWLRAHVLSGGVFAYATEAVFGLGGHPGMARAVKAILQIKAGRSAAQGMILVAGAPAQAQGFVRGVDAADWQKMLAAQERRATTFLLPAGEKVAADVVVDGKVALRLSRHAQLAEVTAFLGFPLLSTSANRHGEPPARSVAEVLAAFPDMVVLAGDTGGEARPSRVLDYASGQILRE